MININILNEILKGVSEQIPLVNSFYTQSPYDSWNVSEVKYGSVSFVVTDIQTRQSTTTYTATLYYGDRLLEDGSNRDSVYSDSATVIQTIVGALNQCDEYIEVAYPVSITLFEQDFVDHIAGGYATLTISSTGMGECFEDELNIPQIVATSAYYTKEQIAELFPLKTQLSTVAFSGSFSDLRDTPDLVTMVQYNDFVEGVLDGNRTLAEGLKQKVSIGYFDEWANNIEKELDYRVKRSDFDNVVTNLETEIDYINENTISQLEYSNIIEIQVDILEQLDHRVNEQQYEQILDTHKDLYSKIASCVDKQEYNGILDSIQSINTQLDKKLGEVEYNNILNGINDLNTRVDNSVTLQQYNDLINAVETTTTNLAVAIDSKLDDSYFTEWKNQTETELNNKVTQAQYDELVESVIANDAILADGLKDKVSVYHFDLLADDIESRLDNFNTDISKDYYNKDEIDIKLDHVNVDLSDYYTKSEVENRLDSVEVDLDDYYNKEEINNKLDSLIVGGEVNLNNYYTKSEIDDRLDSVEVDLSDYYTKSEVENRLDSVENELSNYYTKSEINTIIGDIDSILNNVLYVY